MQTVKSIDINAVGFVSYDAYVCDDNNTKYEKEEKVNRRIKKERKGKKSRILISSVNLCIYIYMGSYHLYLSVRTKRFCFLLSDTANLNNRVDVKCVLCSNTTLVIIQVTFLTIIIYFMMRINKNDFPVRTVVNKFTLLNDKRTNTE
jgi:hypothetical protein